MARAFAFLRAVNVGGRNLKMSLLREVLSAAGLKNVETFIASGNVVVDSTGRPAALERKIERALEAALGYEVETFVRTAPELTDVVAREAFPAADLASAHALYVGLLKEAPTAKARDAVKRLAGETDSFEFGDRELYWLCRVRFSDSPFSSKNVFEKTLGTRITFRNMTTLQRMASKYGLA